MFVNVINNSVTRDIQDCRKNNEQVDGDFTQNLDSIETESRYDALFIKAGKEWNIPAGLLKTMAKVESSFNPNAVSHAGAQGLMQLMPETGRSLGVNNPFDPEENISAAAKYLRSLLNKYDGDIKLALAAYNAGPGNVAKFQGVPPFSETKRYLEKILGNVSQGEIQVIRNEIMSPPLDQKECSSSELLNFWVELNLIRTLLESEEKENNNKIV